jgi:Protein of unknown function (DUF3489)
MPTLSIEKSRNLESAIPKKGSAQSFASRRRKAPSGAASPKKQLRPVGSKPARATGGQRPPKADEPQIERIIRQKKRPRSGHATQIAAAKAPEKAEDPKDERVTKQERMLTLLSRPDGASIQEMMQAANWQQHSVRGFLAGTVKKKLGFSLTSSKPDDGVRRYRIATRRSR